jgi:integrase
MPRRPKTPRNLYFRDGIWYARIRQRDGSKRRVSTGLADREAAILWRDREEQRAQRVASGLSPEAQAHSVADALDWWLRNRCVDRKPKTRTMYEYATRCLRDYLGPVPVNALTREDVQGYFQHRLEGVEDPKNPGERIGMVARSTVLKERITLRAALLAAAERGLFVRTIEQTLPPFRFRYVPRRVFLRFEDFPRLLAELEPHRRWWVRVVVYSGAGHAEVEALDWGDDQGSVLRIPGTKTETRDRLIPIGPELRAVLDEVPKADRRGPIVEPWLNVNRDLGRACERASIEPRVTAHDLRRTFGSWLAQRGVSTKAIGELLGHAPGSKMADLTYSVLTDETLRDAVGRLPGARNVRPMRRKGRQ